MKTRTLVRQTMFLSASHFLVRVLGFALRIWLSRSLGAQAIGLVELAGSAQMLLITPVISGLPAAMSRMCAKAEPTAQIRVLRSGMLLSLLFSLPVMALAFIFRTQLALWLGDIRTLPALLICLPCIPVLGLSCAMNGYYYGTGKPAVPAASELLEQVIRLWLTIRLVHALRGWPVMLRAAIPASATLIAESAAMLLMLLLSARILLAPRERISGQGIKRELIALALPLTGMRLVSSLMRTVQSLLIPQRLQAGGLSSQAALARLGMINGMMMPVLLLPSFITCSLSMIAAPELTRRQAQGKPQRPLVLRILGITLLISLAAMAFVFMLAPMFAGTLYRQAELKLMLQRSCPLVPVMALCQVSSSLMNGLGLQGVSLRISVASNLLGTLLMYVLAAIPTLHLWGVIIAMAAAQAATLTLSLRALLKAID